MRLRALLSVLVIAGSACDSGAGAGTASGGIGGAGGVGGSGAIEGGTGGVASSGGSAASSGIGGTGGSIGVDAGRDAALDASVAVDAGSTATDAGTTPAAVCPGGPYGASVSGPTTAMLVSGGFDFVEGPVWVAAQGALFFSDMDFGNIGADGAASRIHRFVPPSTFDVFVPSSGSNGLALEVEGTILAATHDTRTLSRFDASTGARETLAVDYMGMKLNSPNDLTIRSDGNVYFTDPDWQLTPRTPEVGFTGVYRRSPAGAISLVDETLDKPNGIALSPDEQTLYVGSAGNDVWRYDVAPDGSVSGAAVFASPGASDGFAIDCAGNLYVTAGAVQVFDPTGTKLGEITLAEEPANAAFGGSDRRTLYITARTGLYAVDLGVPGYPY